MSEIDLLQKIIVDRDAQITEVTAERDALRQRVADLERRLADLTRAVVAAEVEDDA